MAKGIDWSKTYKIKVATLLDVFLQGEKGWLRAGCILALCLAIPFWILWRAFFGVLPPGADRGVIVSLFLSYAFLLKPLGTKTWRDKQHPFYAYIDVVCIILALAVGAYKLWGDYFDTRTLTMSIFSSQVQVDLLPGIAAIILVLEATRRMTDWWLVITPVFFIFYAIFSDYLPGIWGGPAVPWQHLINLLFIETEGIYGVGTQVITTTIFLFMFFGTIMMEAKAGNFLIAFGNAAVGRYRGGTAKMAVVSSAFMGTMTGSPAANVAICGTFTIPMMKETGYPPIYAAAVETVASNGGAIMPPVMASMAFLMAAYLGVPYSKIIVYAAVPAVLYYLSLFWAVDLKAKSLGLKGLPRENLPSMRRVLWEGGYLLIPVCLMIYLLLAEYSVSMVGFCSVVAMFILTFARRQTRFNCPGCLKHAGSHNEKLWRCGHSRYLHGARHRSHRLVRSRDAPLELGAATFRRFPDSHPVSGGYRHLHIRSRNDAYHHLHHHAHLYHSGHDKGRHTPCSGTSLYHLLGNYGILDPARLYCSLCRCRYRRISADENRLGCDEIRTRDLSPPLCFLFQSKPTPWPPGDLVGLRRGSSLSGRGYSAPRYRHRAVLLEEELYLRNCLSRHRRHHGLLSYPHIENRWSRNIYAAHRSSEGEKREGTRGGLCRINFERP